MSCRASVRWARVRLGLSEEMEDTGEKVLYLCLEKAVDMEALAENTMPGDWEGVLEGEEPLNLYYPDKDKVVSCFASVVCSCACGVFAAGDNLGSVSSSQLPTATFVFVFLSVLAFGEGSHLHFPFVPLFPKRCCLDRYICRLFPRSGRVMCFPMCT